MAKLKAARPGKKTKSGFAGAIPCLILVITAILLVSLLFYGMLKGS